MINSATFISNLEAQLNKPLPGAAAQLLMAPEPKSYYDLVSDNPREAAVLALIYPIDHVLHLAYIKRASGDSRDKHAGQISFPGGKLELTDNSLLDCALREADEEVGIKKDEVKVLGQLSQVFVFVSNFIVLPYVGYSDTRPQFVKDETEVQQILEVPVNHLMDEKNQKTKDLSIRNYTLKDVPYYDLDGKVLWGATAMMTSELIYLIKEDIT